MAIFENIYLEKEKFVYEEKGHDGSSYRSNRIGDLVVLPYHCYVMR